MEFNKQTTRNNKTKYLFILTGGYYKNVEFIVRAESYEEASRIAWDLAIDARSDLPNGKLGYEFLGELTNPENF